jgi:hypothetical protein
MLRMRYNLASKLTLAILFVTATVPAFTQVVPSATEGASPLTLGGGVSSIDMDWGHGRMEGGTLWAEWNPSLGPKLLSGFGLAVEARDIRLNHSTSQPANLREDTAFGGAIYTWRHYRNFHPYGKYLMGLGGIDFTLPTNDPYFAKYHHDTRTVTAPVLGLEYRAFRHVWVRAEYEYEFWPGLLGYTSNPQGFTAGAVYNFKPFHAR